MADNMITVFVENPDGTTTALEAPTDMGLSLMELLKANEFEVMATCGGMALCATCCIDVIEGQDLLPEIADNEYAMLDTLPDVNDQSRLACQLKLSDDMNNMRFKLHPVDN